MMAPDFKCKCQRAIVLTNIIYIIFSLINQNILLWSHFHFGFFVCACLRHTDNNTLTLAHLVEVNHNGTNPVFHNPTNIK